MILQSFFEKYPKVAVAFSGGVDSSYLLYAAGKYAQSVKAYYVKSEFQPNFEMEDAVKLAGNIGADMKIINLNVLTCEDVVANPADRCYFCKKHIFSAIMAAAGTDGYEVILDGTNASDDADDRPGMKALSELKVLSPLRMCGLTKPMIRKLSKVAGLFTWDKPAYACLATRIQSGYRIESYMLDRTEKSEKFLENLGFRNHRVRTVDNGARIQIRKSDADIFAKNKDEILRVLGSFYDFVLLDTEYRDEL